MIFFGDRSRLRTTAYASCSAVSAALIAAAHQHWLVLGQDEAWGFVTGGWGVWLTVQKNVWTWPVGLANNVFFFVLFLHARLFADAALQIVYIILGMLGWYWWLFGGEHNSKLRVATAPKVLVIYVAISVAIGTVALTIYLTRVGDSVPFADAFTTALSLGGQFLLSKKLLDNWYFWIAADVIYIWLYAYKGLFLTSALYTIFLLMCFAGLVRWRASLIDAPASAIVV